MMDFNVLAFVTDAAIVIALVIIIQVIKSKVDPFTKWPWWFALVLGIGYVVGLVTELVAQPTVWGVIRSGFLYAAAMITTYQAYKAVVKTVNK